MAATIFSSHYLLTLLSPQDERQLTSSSFSRPGMLCQPVENYNLLINNNREGKQQIRGTRFYWIPFLCVSYIKLCNKCIIMWCMNKRLPDEEIYKFLCQISCMLFINFIRPEQQSRWRNGLARLQQWPCYLQRHEFESHLQPVDFSACKKVSPFEISNPNAKICAIHIIN